MVKYIPLSKGMVAIIDDCDYELVSRYKWHASSSAIGKYYARSSNKGNRIYMHRLITNAPNDKEVDHINQNRLDNRRSNLRLCNRSQNNCNQGLRTDNTSDYIGVDFHKQTKKWRARIYNNGSTIFLGFFDTAEEAAIARNHAAKKYYGEFAEFNNVDNWELAQVKERSIVRSDSTTGFRGVTKCNNRWRACISFNKKTFHLGYFDTPIDAAIAYDKASYKQHGKFAVINFPIENYEES
jgi:hypothetical protein